MALEPITRKEKIIAGEDLQPITRLEKFLKEYGGSGGGGSGADDVYLIKHITNYDTGAQELQGDYAGALAAYESGKSLKFVKAMVDGGKEFVDYESFAYCFVLEDSFFSFSCYTGSNFATVELTESGISDFNDETRFNSLYVNNPSSFFLKSASNKLFRVTVSDTGELSTEEIT